MRSVNGWVHWVTCWSIVRRKICCRTYTHEYFRFSIRRVFSSGKAQFYEKNHIILLKFIPKHTILRLHLNTLFKKKSSFNFTRTELILLTEKPIDRNIIEKKYISFFVLEQLSKALKQTKSPLGAAWSISFERRTSVNQQLYQLSNMVLKVIHETNIMYILHTEIILYWLLVIVISREAQKATLNVVHLHLGNIPLHIHNNSYKHTHTCIWLQLNSSERAQLKKAKQNISTNKTYTF